MIRELLNPKFLKGRIEYLADQEPTGPSADIAKEAEKAGVSLEDIEQAQRLLADLAATRDYSRKEGEAAWLPRDADLGIVQSVLEEFYRRNDAVQKAAPQRFLEEADPISDDNLKTEWVPTPQRPFMRPTEESDVVRWGVSFAIAKAIAAKHGKAEFRKQTRAVPIRPKVRLVLFADWATGVARALRVRDQIKRQLDPREADGHEPHVIHLGDVYYAGRDFEYEQHIARDWPVTIADASTVGSWCLNGNHDMFSGGKPFFEFLARDRRFRAQNCCSYFALENDHWLIFGLDSAYESEGMKGDAGGLASPQADWVMDRIRESPGKKVILLTHHQPFSAWENGSPLMVNALDPVLQREKGVTAWFWGHEHRCAVYEPTPKIAYPALIGHGGVPVYASKKEPKPDHQRVRFWDKRSFRHYLETYSYMGFAVLDLDGDTGTVHYIDENGKPTKEEPDTVI